MMPPHRALGRYGLADRPYYIRGTFQKQKGFTMERLAEAFGEAFRRQLRKAGARTKLLHTLPTEARDEEVLAFARANLGDDPGRLFTALYGLHQKTSLDLSVEAFAISDQWAPMFTAKELGRARRRLDRHGYPWLDLPKRAPPMEHGGVMSLTDAAQWVATRGGVQSFSASDGAMWGAAFVELLDAIAEDRVQVTGIRTDNAEQEIIPSYKLSKCAVAYPFGSPEQSWLETNAHFIWAFTGDGKFHTGDGPLHLQGFVDQYCQGSQTQWNHLQVRQPLVRTHWPFSRENGERRGRRHKGMDLVRDWLTECSLNTLHGATQLSLTKQILAELAPKFEGPEVAAPAVDTIAREIRRVRRARSKPS